MDGSVFDRFVESARYVDHEIVSLQKRPRNPEGKVRTVAAFNAELGNPQAAFPSIQVAGTSGKGSVSSYLACILWKSGLKTGLHTSPYLQVITEKTWCNGSYCSAGEFTAALDRCRPLIEKYRNDPSCVASVHGMAALAVTWGVFRGLGLDAAVLETGMGGRFDLIQGIAPVLTVITDLGMDHQEHLGSTVEEIAWHKAGIMKPGIPCVAVKGPGWEVLDREARAVGAELSAVAPELVLRRGPGRSLRLALPCIGTVETMPGNGAGFSLRNAAVAAAAADRLAALGWPVTAASVSEGLAAMSFPGRFEVVQTDPVVILDGAHNPQKMQALAAEFALAPDRQVCLLGFTGGRDPGPMLQSLRPCFGTLVATAPTLHGKDVLAPDELCRAARAFGFRAFAAPEAASALELALELTPAAGTLLVSGSLYLLGSLRNRWYPWQDVLEQRTSYPVLAGHEA